MYLIETIFITLGFLGVINGLFNKFSVWGIIEKTLLKVSNKTRIKLFYSLAFCTFCQRFWISVILTLIVCAFDGYYWETIIVPFVVFGLFNVMHKE